MVCDRQWLIIAKRSLKESTMKKLIIAGLLGLFCLNATGGNIYRWVDEKGVVHYGDTVPDQYKSTATRKSELKDAQPTTNPGEEAAAQKARERARAVLERKPEEAAPPPVNGPAATAPAAETIDTSKLSCEQQWARYNASQGCFAPFRNADGSIRAEAYDNCTQVPQPARCD
jgi:hypothetical protein